MIFKAAITVIPNDGGKSQESKEILKQLKNIKANNVTDIIVGRYISVNIDANSKNAASALVGEISELLIDKQVETVSFTIEEI